MPISDSFDDIYFSNQDGAAETQYVFLRGNRLPQRFQQWPSTTPFVIAETGFGSGLNMLLAAQAFLQQAPLEAHLQLVSFERYPMQKEDIVRALQHWPQLAELCNQLVTHYPPILQGVYRLSLHPRITLDLHFGDVLDMLPAWVAVNPAQVHAWFLDGFAPGKNPDMWQPALYNAMAAAASATCTLATFTAVGAVRRGLIEAGFAMHKEKGFGPKREMLTGYKVKPQQPPRREFRNKQPRRIAVVGGGIAAASVLRLLSDIAPTHNLELHLFCRDRAPAEDASGNAQGAVYPLLQADFTPTTQFYTQAFNFARTCYQRWAPDHCHWSGVLQLGFNANVEKRQRDIVTRTNYPSDLVYQVSADQAASLSGVECETGGLFYPSAGWVTPRELTRQLIQDSHATLHMGKEVTLIAREGQHWRLHGLCKCAEGNKTDSSWEYLVDDVIFANGTQLAQFSHQSYEIRPVGGQVTQVQSSTTSAQLKTVICHKGYFTPAQQGSHCVGATYTKLGASDEALFVRNKEQIAADNEHNIALNARHTGLQFSSTDVSNARRAVRATTPNHLPLVGAHPHYRAMAEGVWVLGGLGSRGLTCAPWCAQWLIDQMFGQVQAANSRVAKAISSTRHQI